MDTTTNRTGAVWVAGTGAFLLLAATALFVAVRWDDLPDAAKLGVVGALTGGFLLGGRALARTLPATGDVLFHLGALLIPVDVAAVAVRLHLGWRGLLLAEGLAAGGAIAALATGSGSVVLTWTAGLAPLALASGFAGISPVPAPLLLAMAAVTASAAATTARSTVEAGDGGTRPGYGDGSDGDDGGVTPRLALGWAAVAGLAPMLAAVAAGLLRAGSHAGLGVLAELGLAGRASGWAAVASGALAAGVIGREAKARSDSALAGLAVAVLVAGLISAGVGADLSGAAAEWALPGLFVAVEVAALVARRDEFWGRIGARAALFAEVPAVAFGWTAALWSFVASPVVDNLELFGERFRGEPVTGVAFGLLAVGWFVMGARRLEAGERIAPFRAVQAAVAGYPWLLAPVAVGAVSEGTASGPLTAAACLGLGALLSTAGRRSARLTAGFLALWAPLCTLSWHWAALAAGIAGAAVATLAARQAGSDGPRCRTGQPWVEAALLRSDRPTCRTGQPGVEAALLTLAALGAPSLAYLVCSLGGRGIVAGSLLWVGAGFAVAAALEPAPLLPDLGRISGAFAAVAVAADRPALALPALALATVLAVVDAIGRDRPVIAIGAAATVQFLVFDVARGSGLSRPEIGLALCISAVVWAGLALVTDERWRWPLLAASGAGLAWGLGLASLEPRAGADALLIAGGLVAAAGLAARRPAVTGAGAALVCLAIGSHLEQSHVRAGDAYLAPVAALLLGAGFHLRRHGGGQPAPSSWVAYAPAVALLGGAALVERIAGGGGVHALVAGAVGIAAVAFGGGGRLAGPLVTGTALLVAVTVHESLGTLATVPTWGWLAAGGSLLLATGVSLERRGVSDPVDAGRRLVDVVAERFS